MCDFRTAGEQVGDLRVSSTPPRPKSQRFFSPVFSVRLGCPGPTRQRMLQVRSTPGEKERSVWPPTTRRKAFATFSSFSAGRHPNPIASRIGSVFMRHDLPGQRLRVNPCSPGRPFVKARVSRSCPHQVPASQERLGRSLTCEVLTIVLRCWSGGDAPPVDHSPRPFYFPSLSLWPCFSPVRRCFFPFALFCRSPPF